MADELHRQGVRLAVISPGSRSASLSIALEEHAGMVTRVVLDERSAAFHALGHARATGSPAVCVATSGTAAANYLPAVVEAAEDMVPLIAISADRPPELRHVGANQTVDQIGMFGGRVRWFCDVGVSDATSDLNAYWRSTISQAFARAKGFGGRPGPVHLNVGFREPTAPVSDDGRSLSDPYPHSIAGRSGASPWQVSEIAPSGPADLGRLAVSRGLIVAGSAQTPLDGLLDVADGLGWPVLATALSGLRDRAVVTAYHHILVDGVPSSLEPEAVIVIGSIGPSDRLGALTALECPQVQINPWGNWHDPRRHGTHMVQANPVESLRTITNRPEADWAGRWKDVDAVVRRALDERLKDREQPSGPTVARLLAEAPWEALTAASSMPVRDVDAHMARGGLVTGNRGASGIDGFVSMTLGVAGARPRTLGLIGDLSFLHDLSGFLVDELPDVVFVVVDNNGGGLFDLLPHATYSPAFERLFVAPHDSDVAGLAEAQGLESQLVTHVQSLPGMVADAFETGGAQVLVVPVDREDDLKNRRQLDEAAQGVLASLS
jgi:2-succinyl-5-enolpyruvyl-6-hydroxy-3-cyclohexene-1-carboxylate synthase